MKTAKTEAKKRSKPHGIRKKCVFLQKTRHSFSTFDHPRRIADENKQKTMEQISNEIIERCRCGDKAAFRHVVQSYQRMVYALAFRLLCNEEEAKDIVQETMIRVWLNFRSFDPSAGGDFPLRTWIYTIATHLCLDRLKQESRLEPMPEDESCFKEYMADTETDRRLMNQELMAVIRTLVSQLSPKQRIVFTLVHLENMNTEEVVKISGMDAEKVKSNLYVARKTIRERLKKLGYE